MYVCVKPKHCGEYYQFWTSVSFTQPVTIFGTVVKHSMFMRCAAIKIFPPCSSALFRNTLIPVLANDLRKIEACGLLGSMFLCYDKEENQGENDSFVSVRSVALFSVKVDAAAGCRVDLVSVPLICLS